MASGALCSLVRSSRSPDHQLNHPHSYMLRRLRVKGGGAAVPPGEALFTSAQAVAGKSAYQRNCASCHGASVDDGNSAPPLRGAAFLSKFAGNLRPICSPM